MADNEFLFWVIIGLLGLIAYGLTVWVIIVTVYHIKIKRQANRGDKK